MEEESANPSSSKLLFLLKPTSSNRLLFDRRYGWVFDEWKDPSEEALSGGRGMFCILPLAKAFWNTASQSINRAANFSVKFLERPDLFSHLALQGSFCEQLSKFKSTMLKPSNPPPPHLQIESKRIRDA